MTEPKDSHKARAILRSRKRGEWMFRLMGLGSVILASTILGWLLLSLISSGHNVFYQHSLDLKITLDRQSLFSQEVPSQQDIRAADYRAVIKTALEARFPRVQETDTKKELYALVSLPGASNAVRQYLSENMQTLSESRSIILPIPVSGPVDQYLKHDEGGVRVRQTMSAQQRIWINALIEKGDLKAHFNMRFFFAPDSPNAELAGIGSAFLGSLMAILIAYLVAAPIGLGAAIYLEEFAPKNRFTDIVEININNLAAVPPILFGLLGLFLFLELGGLPRAAPLVAGLVLALMALPTLIITTRAALRQVSQHRVDSALSLGASHMQALFHHKIPEAGPGILTGTILSMAQMLGEAAPLLLIGMVAYVSAPPSSLTDAASALPIQIFLWAENADHAWVERTAAAILVLLVMMTLLNLIAFIIRSRLERK